MKSKFFLLVFFIFMIMANTNRDEFLGKLVDPEDVIARVNERFDQLFIVDAKGNRKPHVCCVCDEVLVGSEEMQSLSLKKMKDCRNLLSWGSQLDDRRKQAIEDYYCFDVEASTYTKKADLDFLKGMALCFSVGFSCSEGGERRRPALCCALDS